MMEKVEVTEISIARKFFDDDQTYVQKTLLQNVQHSKIRIGFGC